MKSLPKFAFVAVFAFLCAGATCWKPIARTVLDFAEYECLFLHPDLADEKALAIACNIGEDLIPEVRKILMARKAAAAKMAASAPSASASGK